MKTTHLISLSTVGSLAALMLAACGEKSDSNSSSGETSSNDNSRIEAAFVDAEPENSISVLEARKSAEPGTSLTVTGRIAGTAQPFSTDYATLVLADASIETCERIPGDSCPTPWDACCVEPKTLAASRLTVQVVGVDGRPIDGTLKEVRGLKELDTLVVTGTVAEGSSDANLIINATGIYPKKES